MEDNSPKDRIVIDGVEYVKTTDTNSNPTINDSPAQATTSEDVESSNFKSKMWIAIVILTILSFAVPGFAFIGFIAFLIFTTTGAHTMEKDDIQKYGEPKVGTRLFKILGRIAISIAFIFMALVALLIFFIASGGFKIG